MHSIKAETSSNYLSQTLTQLWDRVVRVIKEIANFIFSRVSSLFGYGDPTKSSSSSSVITLPSNRITSNTNAPLSDSTRSSFLVGHLGSLSLNNILRCILPGNLTAVATTSEMVTLCDGATMSDEQQIEKKVKAWLGKKEGEALTEGDILSLRKYIRYRFLPLDLRIVICQKFVQSLFPLLEACGAITLPFNSYLGRKLFIERSQDGSLLLKEGVESNSLYWALTIHSSGYCIYADTYVTICEDYAEPKEEYELKSYRGKEWIFEKNGQRLHPLNRRKEVGPAHLELLFFKYDDMIAFLKGESTKQAEMIFDRCCAILNDIDVKDDEQEKAVAHQPKGSRSMKTEMGPIWSPVATSEDSIFIWTVTRLESGQKALSLQKKASGRGLMGGSVQRSLTLKTTDEFNQFEIEVKKSYQNDLEASSSISTYLLKKENDGIRVIPQGKVTQSDLAGFFLGSESHEASSEIQSHKEMREEGDFIFKTLTTIADIVRSPDTMMLDENHHLVNLQGQFVPLERLELLSSVRQGIYGAPAFHYNFVSGGSGLSLNGYTVSITPPEQPQRRASINELRQFVPSSQRQVVGAKSNER